MSVMTQLRTTHLPLAGSICILQRCMTRGGTTLSHVCPARCKITLQHCLCEHCLYQHRDQHLSCVTAQPRGNCHLHSRGNSVQGGKETCCLLGDLASPHTACSPRLKVAGTTSVSTTHAGFPGMLREDTGSQHMDARVPHTHSL